MMNISNPEGEPFIGGSQEWYADRWQKLSGCGPTAASNLIWYITRQGGCFDQYSKLQHEMFSFVTPTARGVNTSSIFTEGVKQYGTEHGLAITTHVLEIPAKPCKRPKAGEVRDFFITALEHDSPVAFLNLSNGTLANLEDWHWVTVISLEADTLAAEISDQGKVLEISLSEWLETSLLGGALVWVGADSSK